MKRIIGYISLGENQVKTSSDVLKLKVTLERRWQWVEDGRQWMEEYPL